MIPRPSKSNVPRGCIPFGECRAKTCPDGSPGTFVFDHCRYAGYVAEALLPLLPPALRRVFPAATPFSVALHDVGKVSPGFEGKYFFGLLREKSPDWAAAVPNGGVETNHASIGAKSLLKMFGLPADHPLVRAIAAHHGFFGPLNFSNDGDWQQARSDLVAALAKEFGVAPDSAVSARAPVELLAGLTCVSDWIASDETFFPPNEAPLPSDAGRRRAAEAVATCGFRRAEFRRGLSFRDIFGFDPYPAQRTFLDAVDSPGVYVLEAPMGMGKTEAALYAAYRLVESGRHSGLYFALPTRLTSDRIHERVEAFLRAVSATPSAVKLAHGQAWLKEFDSGAEGSGKDVGNRVPPWFNPSKRGLLFPFAVGTIDQALLSVLNVKHSFVRSFALAGKVVVLDEVHSYDAYTGTLLDELVARLRELGCTVIVLSATLTAARRGALLRGANVPDSSAYPLLSGIRAESGEAVVRALEPPPPRTVRLRWIDAAAESPLAAAIEKARAGCNVLCIANTVPTAQEWFRAIRSELGRGCGMPVGLLHAKFTAGDRDAAESVWMSRLGKTPKSGSAPRPHGSILVATQIVEQSVDIDADWMLSELAPADMLLQRLGRLWRHERGARPVAAPELAVVCARMPSPDLSDLPKEKKELEAFFGRGVWVYAPYVLLRTLETLRGRDSIRVPSDIRPILEEVYAAVEPATPVHRALRDDMAKEAEKLRQRARMGESDALPTRSDDETTAGTRYNSRPSVSLLLVRRFDAVSGRATLLDGTEVTLSRFHRDFNVTKALYRNLVQVAPNDALHAEESESDLLCRHFFASEMPHICTWDPDSGALALHRSGADSGYSYRHDLGAYRIAAAPDRAESPSLPEAPVFPDAPEVPEAPDSQTPGDPPDAPDGELPDGEFIFKDGMDW